MTLPVRAGLPSREAAYRVIDELRPDFFDGGGMRDWLTSAVVAELSAHENWSTPELDIPKRCAPTRPASWTVIAGPQE